MARLNEMRPQPLYFPGEEALRDRLTGFVQSYGDVSKARAQLTPEEQAAMELVGKYAGTPSGANAPFQAAQGEILGTLGGGYDPETSSYYAPLMRGIEQRRGQAISRTRRGYQIGGNLSSLARARAEGELETGYDAEIANLMIGLQERERQRKLDVLGNALKYGEYVEEGPLRRAQALTTTGNIPRQLETRAIDVGQNVLTRYDPTYYNPLNYQYFTGGGGQSKNKWGNAAAGAAGGASTGLALGGPWGAAGGAIAGGLLGYFG